MGVDYRIFGADMLSRNVPKYQSTLNNVAEERIYRLYGGGRPKSGVSFGVAILERVFVSGICCTRGPKS